MATAVIEFDALPDAVWAAAQNDHLLAVGWCRLVGPLARERPLVRRIHVGGRRGEFGGAGIDTLENRTDTESMPPARHLLLRYACKPGEPRIRETHRLQATQCTGGRWQRLRLYLGLHLDDVANCGKEPRIDLAGVVDRRIRDAKAHCLGNDEQSIRRGDAERRTDGVLVIAFAEPFDIDLV